jgi:putative transposase
MRLTFGVLGFTAGAQESWLAQPLSDRDRENACLTEVLIHAPGDAPTFGYGFLACELGRAGITVGERRL